MNFGGNLDSIQIYLNYWASLIPFFLSIHPIKGFIFPNNRHTSVVSMALLCCAISHFESNMVVVPAVLKAEKSNNTSTEHFRGWHLKLIWHTWMECDARQTLSIRVVQSMIVIEMDCKSTTQKSWAWLTLDILRLVATNANVEKKRRKIHSFGLSKWKRSLWCSSTSSLLYMYYTRNRLAISLLQHSLKQMFMEKSNIEIQWKNISAPELRVKLR